MDIVLQDREAVIQLLKHHLTKAQQCMAAHADKHRSYPAIDIGDIVYLELQPYRQSTVMARDVPKLAAKYFEP